jgi:hypothetical protein
VRSALFGVWNVISEYLVAATIGAAFGFMGVLQPHRSTENVDDRETSRLTSSHPPYQFERATRIPWQLTITDANLARTRFS